MATAHGGSISVTSSHLTCFKVTLPHKPL
ncbi:hypothetical protein [Caballeronia sp. LZ035]